MKKRRLVNPFLLAALCLPGCGDDTSGGAPVGGPSGTGTPDNHPSYSIKVHVGDRVVRIGPEMVMNDHADGPQATTQAIISLPDGEANAGALSSYVLLAGAAAECGVHNARLQGAKPFPPAANASESPLPWRGDSWFVFDGKGPSPQFDSCDDVLYHTEVLLCMADKLSEVADAVAPVVWKGTAQGLIGLRTFLAISRSHG